MNDLPDGWPLTRREALSLSGGLVATALLPVPAPAQAQADASAAPAPTPPPPRPGFLSIRPRVNGQPTPVTIDPRTSLLDLLREHLHLTGAKKGCDHGQCGACTVHLNGRRVVSCLTLAAKTDGADVRTIEGLSDGETLHPMQQAFIDHDALQCGYCTPGQIMAAVACVQEGHATSPDSIREYMSGNLCRCGAYTGIVAAITAVAGVGVGAGPKTEPA